jgi:Flp pilus assembly protein TadD
MSPAAIAAVELALDEQRYVDAARLLDAATVNGVSDPQLSTLSGELDIARGRYAAALDDFARGEAAEATRPRALQGRGLALAMMGRSDDAVSALRQAVALDPKAWRAWNALGALYDGRREWGEAEAAYQQAVESSGNDPIVLNNRGYSHLLQRRPEEAVSDFVAALQKKPDLAAARTNLRLALAMRGDYERALAGVSAQDRAIALNNAGFAAGLRGDYAKAQSLLGEAIQARADYYGRAAENLSVVQGLAARPRAN